MRSVLDQSNREDVRLHQPRCANASAFGLRGYADTLSPLVVMHLLDISCVSVGIFLKLHATFPNSGIRARSMRRLYARVEHKELWAVIVILLTTNVLF